MFQQDRSVIGKHVRNIFKEGELKKDAVWAKFAYTASDGKEYNVVRQKKFFTDRPWIYLAFKYHGLKFLQKNNKA